MLENLLWAVLPRVKKMNNVPFGLLGIFRVREVIDRYENAYHRRRQNVRSVKQSTRRKRIKMKILLGNC